MVEVSREEFEQWARWEYRKIPREFRQKLHNVTIVVEDEPGEEAGRHRKKTLLGLYVGAPRTSQSVFDPIPYPAHIYLYQLNIQRICRTRTEVRRQIRETLLHEIGHHFGMTEAQLQEIEQGWYR